MLFELLALQLLAPLGMRHRGVVMRQQAILCPFKESLLHHTSLKFPRPGFRQRAALCCRRSSTFISRLKRVHQADSQLRPLGPTAQGVAIPMRPMRAFSVLACLHELICIYLGLALRTCV